MLTDVICLKLLRSSKERHVRNSKGCVHSERPGVLQQSGHVSINKNGTGR